MADAFQSTAFELAARAQEMAGRSVLGPLYDLGRTLLQTVDRKLGPEVTWKNAGLKFWTNPVATVAAPFLRDRKPHGLAIGPDVQRLVRRIKKNPRKGLCQLATSLTRWLSCPQGGMCKTHRDAYVSVARAIGLTVPPECFRGNPSSRSDKIRCRDAIRRAWGFDPCADVDADEDLVGDDYHPFLERESSDPDAPTEEPMSIYDFGSLGGSGLGSYLADPYDSGGGGGVLAGLGGTAASVGGWLGVGMDALQLYLAYQASKSDGGGSQPPALPPGGGYFPVPTAPNTQSLPFDLDGDGMPDDVPFSWSNPFGGGGTVTNPNTGLPMTGPANLVCDELASLKAQRDSINERIRTLKPAARKWIFKARANGQPVPKDCPKLARGKRKCFTRRRRVACAPKPKRSCRRRLSAAQIACGFGGRRRRRR